MLGKRLINSIKHEHSCKILYLHVACEELTVGKVPVECDGMTD